MKAHLPRNGTVVRMKPSFPRALAVEDDTDLHALLETVLAETVSLTFASTLAEARRALSSEDFAVMLLDIHLPDGSGMDLLSKVRHLDRCKNLPVIMMTTSDNAEHYEDSLWLGSLAYVRKPLDITKLSDAVRTALLTARV